MRLKHLFILLTVVSVMGAVFDASAEVTTTRDDKGVWFVKGDASDSLYDTFKAVGYAVAQDRLWQAETLRRAARGQLAEIFGPDYLEQDVLVRLTGYSNQELTDGYNGLDADTKEIIKGYADGFNQHIAEVTADPTQLPIEFHAIAQMGLASLAPEPWTVEDILAWTALMLRQFDPEAMKQGQLSNAALMQYLTTVFGATQGYLMFNDLRWTNDPAAQTYIPAAQSDTTLMAAAAMPAKKTAPAVPFDLKGLASLAGVSEKINKRMADREAMLEKINALPKMGSYAWVLSGKKTASGRATIYSGPQMGFDTPAICQEGSIVSAGLNISGMAIPGLPGIVIGRTPHHAWSMQVGHAHTVDYYIEPPPGIIDNYYTSRTETINVAGTAPVTITVYRTPHGPVVNPVDFDPATYNPATDDPIVAWRYSHWGKEFATIGAFLELSRAESVEDFAAGLRKVAVSQHFCYADTDGNIAYWMSGMDPVRPEGVDYRMPQIFPDQADWDDDQLIPLSHAKNPDQGYFAGWNNKSSRDYPHSYNNIGYFAGPFHRAHVLYDYLDTHDDLTFEEIRDLAVDIAATDSIRSGGNPWVFVEDVFSAAVTANPSTARNNALAIMDGFDGHFVAGGKSAWVTGMDRSDAWMLSDAWIREVIDLTFMDELGNAMSGEYDTQAQEWRHPSVLFNVILHALTTEAGGITNSYDWFQNAASEVDTIDEIVVMALDNVLAALGPRPWGIGLRGEIEFNHDILGMPPFNMNPLHTLPFGSRSTYAHCVEIGSSGPVRVESMFPLGQSGTILANAQGMPVFDPNFYSMTPVFDAFTPRDFPVPETADGVLNDDDDVCFISILGGGKKR